MENSAKLLKKFITKDDQNFILDNWIQARFTNIGEANVEIEGTTIGPGETFDASVAHYPVSSNIEVKFNGAGSKRVVVNYGVLNKKC